MPLCYLCVRVCSVVSNSATPWTAAPKGPLSMGFSRQEYWSELPFPPQGIFLTQGSNSYLSSLLHWPGGSSPLCHLGSLLLYSFQIQQKSGSPPAQPPPLLSRGFSEPMSLADEKFSLMKVRYSDAGGR